MWQRRMPLPVDASIAPVLARIGLALVQQCVLLQNLEMPPLPIECPQFDADY